MVKAGKQQGWVFNADKDGAKRKILANCVEMMYVENIFEKGVVGAMHSHPHVQITY